MTCYTRGENEKFRKKTNHFEFFGLENGEKKGLDPHWCSRLNARVNVDHHLQRHLSACAAAEEEEEHLREIERERERESKKSSSLMRFDRGGSRPVCLPDQVNGWSVVSYYWSLLPFHNKPMRSWSAASRCEVQRNVCEAWGGGGGVRVQSKQPLLPPGSGACVLVRVCVCVARVIFHDTEPWNATDLVLGCGGGGGGWSTYGWLQPTDRPCAISRTLPTRVKKTKEPMQKALLRQPANSSFIVSALFFSCPFFRFRPCECVCVCVCLCVGARGSAPKRMGETFRRVWKEPCEMRTRQLVGP